MMEIQNNYSDLQVQETMVAQIQTPQFKQDSNLDGLLIPLVLSLGIFGSILLVWFLNSFSASANLMK